MKFAASKIFITLLPRKKTKPTNQLSFMNNQTRIPAMKKIILLLTFVSLILNSCESSDSAATPPNTSGVLLKKTINTGTDVVTTSTYTYNGFQLDKITSDDETDVRIAKFFYTGNLITKLEDYKNGTLVAKREYTYEEDKMIGIVAYDYTVVPTAKKRTVFDYNSIEDPNFTLFSTYNVNPVTDAETIGAEGHQRYVNNNLGQLLNSQYPAVAGGHIEDTETNYIYDGKITPTKNIIGFYKLRDNVLATSLNNIVRRDFNYETFPGGVLESHLDTYTNTYVYNDMGFPTEKISFGPDNNLESTTEYFYE
jgi:hypothetical protein